jgi:type IV pilus assembly protein PilO
MNAIIREFIRTRRNVLLFVVILTAVNVFLYAYHFLNQTREEARLRGNLFEKTRLMSVVGSTDNPSVFARGKNDLAAFDAGIPPKMDFAKVIGELYDAATGNGLVVGGTTFKAVDSGEAGYVSYSLAMDVSGKYPGIKSFLAELQSLPHSVVVENVGLGGGRSSDEAVHLKLQLTLFLRKERA